MKEFYVFAENNPGLTITLAIFAMTTIVGTFSAIFSGCDCEEGK